MLRIEEIETFYGASQALFGMTMKIGSNEVVTLMGRNGMGKTTTVNSIMGIVRPASGRIVFEADDITRAPAYRIARYGIGLVPEGRQVFPNLSVRENLVATAANRFNSRDPWTVERVLAMFPELEVRMTSMANLLSGGEQQMLAIGRALVTNPRLMILDEATEGLAPLIRQDIWNVIATIRESGISTLVVDKNIKALKKLCDRHVVLVKGKVHFDGSCEELDANVEKVETALSV